MYKKVLKKINLVYTLQIFAVILLFGYTDSAPIAETKQPVNNTPLPLKFNKKAAITVTYFLTY